MNGEHVELVKPTMLDVIEWAKKNFPLNFPPERELTPAELRVAHALWYSAQHAGRYGGMYDVANRTEDR